jgi:hypothetical protein
MVSAIGLHSTSSIISVATTLTSDWSGEQSSSLRKAARNAALARAATPLPTARSDGNSSGSTSISPNGGRPPSRLPPTPPRTRTAGRRRRRRGRGGTRGALGRTRTWRGASQTRGSRARRSERQAGGHRRTAPPGAASVWVSPSASRMVGPRSGTFGRWSCFQLRSLGCDLSPGSDDRFVLYGG